MERSKSGPVHSGLFRILGGIEAGVIGGIWMLGLLVVGSLWLKDPWWTVPNLLGTTLVGGSRYAGFGRSTLVGSALHLVACGTLGAVFGLLFAGVRPQRRLVVTGVLAGAAWHFMSLVWFWPAVNPAVGLYLPQPLTALAHLLLGASLSRVSKYGGIPTSGESATTPIEAPVAEPTADAFPPPGVLITECNTASNSGDTVEERNPAASGSANNGESYKSAV